MEKKKKEIFEQTIMFNIKRKSIFVDKVQMLEEVPLFSWIDINPTELCNRKCTFCPRVDASEYPNQNLHMSVEMATKIAAELKDLNYKGGVVFSGYGEPLLNPLISDIVREFGDEIHTELVTNGDKLSLKIVTSLFDSGLDVLIISMYDGPHQIEEFTKIFNDLNVPESKYILRDRWYDTSMDFGLKLTNRGGTISHENQQNIDTSRPCFYTHYSMMIDWNGDVMLCVQDWNKKVKFGNVFSNSLFSIWRKNNINKYRKMLGKGFRKLAPCNKCDVDGTLHGYNHAKCWNKE
jgi:radical SAM protein with 4Fe4S-binding SPASM domain